MMAYLASEFEQRKVGQGQLKDPSIQVEVNRPSPSLCAELSDSSAAGQIY